MLKLKAWVQEHCADDIHRSHHQGKAVYSVCLDATLGNCLTIFRQHRVANLLVREIDDNNTDCSCRRYWWLTLDTLLRRIHQGDFIQSSLRELGRDGEYSLILHPVFYIKPEKSIYEILECWSHGVNCNNNDAADDDDSADVDGGGDRGDDATDTKSYGLPLVLRLDDELMGVITMRDLLHYIYLYGYHLEYLMGRPAREVPVASLPTLLPKETSAEVCKRVLLGEGSNSEENRVMMGITDSKGRLVAGITIEAFTNGEEEDLVLPILEYLIHISGLTRLDWQPVQYVDTHGQLKFGDLLKRLLQSATHHLWKLNSCGQPEGIVEIRQILQFIYQQIPH